MFRILLFFGLLVTNSLFCSVTVTEENKDEVAVILTRSDSIPIESIEDCSDPYFEGYVQALVDFNYAEYQVVVMVKDKEVWLANLPNNALIADSIVAYICEVPGVKAVHKLNGVLPKDEELREKYVDRPRLKGIWFPQMTELFQPLVADPREIVYSIGYRWGDQVIGDKVVPVSLGDDFSIYRWLDIWGGDLSIGIAACIWSVFDMDPPKPKINAGTELKNTDYFVGIPIQYVRNKWSFRLRMYHISSHLGDEFLVNNPGFVRVNPSREAVDLFASYQVYSFWRIYGGPGVNVHSDRTFKIKPLYFEYGTEVRFLGTKYICQRLYGNFYAAAHFRSWAQLNWDFDGTFVAGYEFSKLQGIGRKIRFFFEYHNGFSLEGQFFNMRTSYWSFKLSYGF